MANEATAINLIGSPPGEPITLDVADGSQGSDIAQGTLMEIDADYNVDEHDAAQEVFGGILAHEKEGGDGSTTVSVYTKGIFDMVTAEAITRGELVALSGTANKIQSHADTDVGDGAIVGKALESASAADETIAIAVGVLY